MPGEFLTIHHQRQTQNQDLGEGPYLAGERGGQLHELNTLTPRKDTVTPARLPGSTCIDAFMRGHGRHCSFINGDPGGGPGPTYTIGVRVCVFARYVRISLTVRLLLWLTASVSFRIRHMIRFHPKSRSDPD